MNVYCLLAKVEEKPTKIAVKQKTPDHYSNLLKDHATVLHMIPKTQKILQIHFNGSTTRAIKVTKTKNVSFKWSNMTDTSIDKDLNYTWDYYYQLPHPHFNFSPPYYSRVKLVADDIAYTPKVRGLAKVFHYGTPRVDLIFQKVDSRISNSPEYIYVSI